MSRPDTKVAADADAVLAALPSIPRDDTGPVFPAPWAASAFAMTLALHQSALFTWPEWAERLGAEIAAQTDSEEQTDAGDPEAYWRCWLAALEGMTARCGVATNGDLEHLQDAWRNAADMTPHGEPIALSEQVRRTINR